MQRAQPRAAAFRFAAFLLAVSLISLGAANLFRSRADTEEDPDFPELFENVKDHLGKFYIDQERIAPRARKLTEKALSTLENMVDEVYVDNSEPDDPHVVVHVGGKSKAVSLARIGELDDGIAALTDLTEFLRANYRGKHTLNDIRYYAVNGFLSALDPHTQVFNPKAFRDFSVHIEGEIFGVGMYVGSSKGILIVRKVLKGTPAERAGFQRADRIVKIGEESTVNMDVNEAVRKIRGLENTKVVLTVKRKESKQSDKLVQKVIEVQRERVTIPSVVSKLLPVPAPRAPGETAEAEPGADRATLGYVNVQNFDKNTVPSLREALESLRRQNGGRELAGLILDLRDNSGGLLQQAQEMADLFLESGELYWIAGKDGREDEKMARNDRREPRYPMVVLSNELSASGAEIVIGALQKNHRAVVLGTTTFGKGSVQQLHPLRENGWQLKITVSEYLIPGKISIQTNGVVPDIYAERVIISDKLQNLFPQRRLGTERDYGDHLVSRYARNEEPAERVQYLVDIPDPEVVDPEEPEPLADEVEPEKDKLTRIAMKLLRSAIADGAITDGAITGGTRGPRFHSGEFLKKHRGDIETIRREQYAEIVDRLKERGIDWQEGDTSDQTSGESPALELAVEHQLVERPSTDKDVDPIAKPFLVMKARATNRSDRPVYRIKGITRSDYYFYREQEFLFGRIDPEATVERTVEVQVPYYPYLRNDSVVIALSGPSGKPFLELEHEVAMGGKERPAFAYSATLLSKESGAPLDQLRPGTEAVVKLKVFNTGRAVAHKGVAILKNESGREVFLEPPGRIEFTELAPGQEKEMEFAFHILPGSTARSYRFELNIVDPYSGESLSRKVQIPGPGEEGIPFPHDRRFQPPSVEAAMVDPRAGDGAQPVLVTDLEELELRGTVSRSQAPFNLWVTTSPLGTEDRDPDKVYFAASRDGKDLPFRTRIRLKKGTHAVHVVASDDHGLQTREVLVVRRREAPVADGLMERIIQAANDVYRQLGPGFRDEIYEAALPLELKRRGLRFQKQPRVTVSYDKVAIGEHRLDLLVEDEVAVELSASGPGKEEEARVRSYLKAAGKEHGLQLHFAGPTVGAQRVFLPRVTAAADK